MRLWIAAAVTIVLAALGLVAVPYAVQWEKFRTDIEAAAKDLTGHEVTIEGPIDVVFLPRPVLTARDVKVAAGPNAAIGFQLTSQQVDLGFRRGPLLVGRPIVDELKLNRPILTLDRAASDKLKAWPPKPNDWSKTFIQPGLRLVTIADGRLDLAGQDAGSASAVSDLSLTLAMDVDKGPIEAVGLFKTQSHHFAIDADLGAQDSSGSSTIKVRIDTRNGVDDATTLSINGVLHRQGPSAGLQGRIDLSGPDLRAGLRTISAVWGYPSTFLSLAPNQAFKMQSRFQADRQALVTEDARMTLNEKSGSGQLALQFAPSPVLDLSLDLPSVRLADETALINFVPLDILSIFPTLPGTVDLRMRELVYRGQTIRRSAIEIVTDQGGVSEIKQAKALFPGLVDVHLDGSVRPSDVGRTLSGRLTAAGDNLGETIRWLDMPLIASEKGWRNFSLESSVDVSSVEITLADIDMRLDSSKLTGQAGFRFSDRLELGLDVDVERLDLDLYAPKSTTELLKHLAAEANMLDLSIDTRLQHLAWQGLRFEEAALSASAREQHFELGSFALKTVGDTTVTVKGDINLKEETVDLTTELSSRFPTRVLRHLDLGLPLISARLKPLILSGRITGELSGFDAGINADYDGGQWLIEGRGGWIDDDSYYDLAITAGHPDHLALAGHFGLAPLIAANDAPGAFEISGQLKKDPQGDWFIAGNAKLGPTSITGRLAEEGGTDDKTWDAKLSVGQPMKDSLAPFLSVIGLRSASDWTPHSILGRLPQTPFRTGWLDQADGSLSVVAKGGLAGDGITLSARLNEGFLYVDKLDAALWNGGLHAEMSLERRRGLPFASLALQLDDVDAEALTAWLDIPRTVEGPLSLDLDASSAGNSAFELMRGAAGSLHIEAGPGKLHGPRIPTFRKTLRDRFYADLDVLPPLGDPFTMPLSNIEADAAIQRGIATFEDGSLSFDPGMGTSVQAGIGGTLDLLLWVADLSLNVRTDGPSTPPLPLRIVGSPRRPQGFFAVP